jgi:hypothetical protein
VPELAPSLLLALASVVLCAIGLARRGRQVARHRGWVRTTGSFEPESDITTLSGYLKQFVSRETANWVAVVLDKAGVIELDLSRPVSARLRADF